MKCKECGAEMYIDDRDRQFKGCEDIYWNCPACLTSCVEEIRFSQSFKEHWHTENDGVKDYTIRKRIDRNREDKAQ